MGRGFYDGFTERGSSANTIDPCNVMGRAIKVLGKRHSEMRWAEKDADALGGLNAEPTGFRPNSIRRGPGGSGVKTVPKGRDPLAFAVQSGRVYQAIEP